MSRLTTVHEQLAEIVAPGTPRTILPLAPESANAGFWHFLGLVSLVRHMMLAAVLSLTLFMGVGLSSYVNQTSIFL